MGPAGFALYDWESQLARKYLLAVEAKILSQRQVIYKYEEK